MHTSQIRSSKLQKNSLTKKNNTMNKEFFDMIENVNHKIDALELLKLKVHTGEYISDEIDTLFADYHFIELKEELYTSTNILWTIKIDESIENYRVSIENIINENINPITEEEI